MHPDLKYVIASLSGIPRILNTIYRRRPLVLAYHGIYDGERRPGRLPATFIHVDDLSTQLQALKRSYRVLHPDQFVHFVQTGTPLPPYSALITFDDGYESFGRLAAPVLERFGLRATVFVATHFIETMKPYWFDIAWIYVKELAVGRCEILKTSTASLPFKDGDAAVLSALKAMTPDQRDPLVAEMKVAIEKSNTPSISDLGLFYPLSPPKLKTLSDNGFSVGGHTHSHTILSTLSDDHAAKEINLNKAYIEDILGRRCHLFAYPNGGFGDFLPSHKDILYRAGYTAAFSLTQRRSSPAMDPMDISRINVAPEDNLRSLMFRACGTVPVQEILRRGRRLRRN